MDIYFRLVTTRTATLPWININQILVEFDSDISESLADDGSDFRLEVVAGERADSTTASVPSIISATWDEDNMRAVLTLNQSIEPSIIRVVATDSDITDEAGNFLNGEWNDGFSTVSGDAIEGGDFSYEMRVLPGDVVKSVSSFETIDPDDPNFIRPITNSSIRSSGQLLGPYDRFADLNGDNRILGNDVQFAERRVGSKLLQAPTNSFSLLIQMQDFDATDAAFASSSETERGDRFAVGLDMSEGSTGTLSGSIEDGEETASIDDQLDSANPLSENEDSDGQDESANDIADEAFASYLTSLDLF